MFSIQKKIIENIYITKNIYIGHIDTFCDGGEI